MKKIFLLLPSFYFLFSISYAQAPGWIWARSIGGSSQEMATSNTVDLSGNSIITGYFQSPTLTIGATTLINTNTTSYSTDMFLAKYDASGSPLWAARAGGAFTDQASAVAVDSLGNIYVAGVFSATKIIFGNDTLTNVAYTTSINDIFLAKYDANGNVLWARSAGGMGSDLVNSVAADNSGNVYMAGAFWSDTIYFGPDTLISIDTTATKDIFLAKYDTNGNILWAKSAGGKMDDDANAVTVDPSGNIFLAGSFHGPKIIFGSDTLINAAFASSAIKLFLTKYDSTGEVKWARTTTGTGWHSANAVVSDANGNAFIAGSFYNSTINFNSTISLTNAGSNDIFLAKYDSSGNVLWARRAGAYDDESATTVRVDAAGNAYVAGNFSSYSFTIGADTLVNADNGGMYLSSDIFLAKYDSNGNALWAKRAGGTGYEGTKSIAVTPSGNTYIAGYFESSIIPFNADTLINIGSTDVFLAKLDSVYITGINDSYASSIISVFPNPSSDFITIFIPCFDGMLAQKSTFEILNIDGQIIQRITEVDNHRRIDISGLANGLYFVKVKTSKGIFVKKFIKQ